MTQRIVVHGLPAGPGRVRGRARVIREISELATVRRGEILIAPYATPDLVLVFDRIVGLVTDYGGRLAHAVIVARELQLPAVVATETATTSIPDGSTVVMDGSAGVIEVVAGV